MVRHDAYYFAGLSGELAALLWDVEDRVQGSKPRALTHELLAEARSIHDRVERFRTETKHAHDERWNALTERLLKLEGLVSRKPAG